MKMFVLFLFRCVFLYLFVVCIFSNLELCLSCSSRTAIDVFECRARSYYCLSLNKRFVVVVVVGNLSTLKPPCRQIFFNYELNS